VPTGSGAPAAIKAFKRAFDLRTVDAVILASVVPAAANALSREIRVKLGLRCLLIGKDIGVPIINLYRKPRQVGVDRLVNALAAHRRYRRAAIVIDFGTAITFDVVSRKGEYLGGVIAPGIEISLEALFQRTALLPRMRMAKPRSVMGRDTVESIRAGCAYGIGGLCDRIVEEIRAHYRFKPLVIATGGYARFMRQYSRSIQKIDDWLTLHGVYQTYHLV
jgi:type III pantothenate kinase